MVSLRTFIRPLFPKPVSYPGLFCNFLQQDCSKQGVLELLTLLYFKHTNLTNFCLQVFLSLQGLLVIGMSLVASFGLCFFLGLFFADMHPTIPFLLLGIGVDDIYVIVQAVDNLTKEEKSLPLYMRMGKAMRHAGVSITVTSITDMAAFLIGSTSVRIK